MTNHAHLSGSDLLAIRFSTNPSLGIPAEYREIVAEIKERAFQSGHDDDYEEACETHCVDDIGALEFDLDCAQSKVTDLIDDFKRAYKALADGEIEAAKEIFHRRLSDEGEL